MYLRKQGPKTGTNSKIARGSRKGVDPENQDLLFGFHLNQFEPQFSQFSRLPLAFFMMVLRVVST